MSNIPFHITDEDLYDRFKKYVINYILITQK